jgi:alkanesulfonate monooxygenase SsuD/methylene tetrahydromethanopterin reductase-like flavin-dependent oxidoreductase (luciferase family)
VLSALAAVTSKIRLGTLVSSVAYRNPAHLAKMAATVDVISGGRLTLGIGAGWYDTEYNQYGWEFPPLPAVRIGQMEDAIRLIKTMWREPRATYHGKYFHIQEAILEPKPVQKPHPPILIGGSGEQLTLRAVAREGTACNLFGDAATLKHKFEVLREHCEKVGRNYDEIERTNTTSFLLARTEAELKAKQARLNITQPIRALMGTVSQAVDWVGQFQDVGVQMVIASFYKNDAETQELYATEVMSKFA